MLAGATTPLSSPFLSLLPLGETRFKAYQYMNKDGTLSAAKPSSGFLGRSRSLHRRRGGVCIARVGREIRTVWCCYDSHGGAITSGVCTSYRSKLALRLRSSTLISRTIVLDLSLLVRGTDVTESQPGPLIRLLLGWYCILHVLEERAVMIGKVSPILRTPGPLLLLGR